MDKKLIKGFTDSDFRSVEKIKSKFPDSAYLKQIHGKKIIYADRSGYLGEADGLYTDKVNILLTVRVADCNAIYLWDEDKSHIMILHAGWKGTVKKILFEGIKILSNKGINKKNINIEISPSARKCCYEVSKDFYNKYTKKSHLFFEKREKQYYLDMLKSNYKIARENGVSSIKISNECTVCNENYFSYRRDNTSKRHLAYIGLRKE